MKRYKTKDKKTTIYDIAAKVGTSTATVSRVLSNSGYPVKEELRRKILDTAAILDYRPNIIGQMLKKSNSKDIGVIVPTISNPFYSQVILGVELEARGRGYNIMLCNSFRDASIEKEYIESLYQKQVNGIIISAINENHSFLVEMQKKGVNIVAFDQNIKELQCSKVGFDFIKGGMMAVENLIQNGHKNIAFLTSPLTRKSRKETMEGYKLALLKNDLEFKEDNVLISDFEKESISGTYEFENGKKLARRFLKLNIRPTAIFAVNDMTAFGAIQELMDKGVKVPEEISVIGFDNIEISSMITPPLSTVNHPGFETGRLAGKLLIDGMESDDTNQISVTLEPSLVERQSVLKI